jgi:hypothetical protein
MEIKQAIKIEWIEKERFLGRKKIVKKNLGLESNQASESFQK